MSRHAARAAARTAAPAGLAVIAFLLITGAPLVGYVVTILALAAGWATTADRLVPGAQLATRVLLAAGVLLLAGEQTTGARWPVVAAGAVLLGLLLSEPLLARLARPWYRAVRLPARPGWPARAVTGGAAWLAGSTGVALVGLLGLLAWPAWTLLVPVLAAACGIAAVAADGVARWRTGHRAELAALRAAVEHHRPRFLLYFSAPPGSEYQVRMWLPYLERLGEPFLVVLPEEHNLPGIALATGAPVVIYDSFAALDTVLVPSVRAAFYVNNGMKNAHCVRFARLTHVQLYHGDSDKAVTASPLNAMYDRIFVAGQAAVDRFAHYGVSIPAEKFSLVGRPQVAQLRVSDEPIGEVEEPVVLYAPTWPGAYDDSHHCSLAIAETILSGLLDRGVTVTLRAHPYAERDRRSAGHLQRAQQLLARDRAGTGRAHRWGREASGPSLFECMNQAHAMVCDVSAVASDFLATGKPFAITDMVGAGDAFGTQFPVARGAYVLDRGAGNLPEVLDDLLARDPLAARRRELRTYYLGDRPPERHAEAFLAEARRWI